MPQKNIRKMTNVDLRIFFLARKNICKMTNVDIDKNCQKCQYLTYEESEQN